MIADEEADQLIDDDAATGAAVVVDDEVGVAFVVVRGVELAEVAVAVVAAKVVMAGAAPYLVVAALLFLF